MLTLALQKQWQSYETRMNMLTFPLLFLPETSTKGAACPTNSFFNTSASSTLLSSSTSSLFATLASESTLFASGSGAPCCWPVFGFSCKKDEFIRLTYSGSRYSSLWHSWHVSPAARGPQHWGKDLLAAAAGALQGRARWLGLKKKHTKSGLNFWTTPPNLPPCTSLLLPPWATAVRTQV